MNENEVEAVARAIAYDEEPNEWHRTRARNAIAALDAAQWRPIETAPRDGTVIDVWLGNAEPGDVEFYCTPGTKRACDWHWFRGKFRPRLGLQAMPTFVVPTHWRPLPPPPGDGT
jgi:hypothetical protein